MKIGDKVKVNETNPVYADFFKATGTIIDEFTTSTEVHKFIVEFDTPVHSNDPDDWDHVLGIEFIDEYDFPDNCLDLI